MARTADVTDAAEVATEPPLRRGFKALALGAVSGLALGGAGFYAVYADLLPLGALTGADSRPAAVQALDAIGFVALDPIVIALPPGGTARHMRFVGQLEVVPAHAAEVVSLMPRIQDVLNTYLRAVEVRDLEQPAATVWLRAQMLRRIQVVTGEGRVRDLLITEFVLN
jgi:flagellar protein FliL